MNTTYTPRNATLELAPPRLLTRADIPAVNPIPNPVPVPSVSSARNWSWNANHLSSRKLPITGGPEQIRMLVCAIDGESWPWTLILNEDESAWFQVLGTHDACILEVSTPTEIGMIARSQEPGATLHMMPKECQHWVRACLTDELLTAPEAAILGIASLMGISIPARYSRRDVHLAHPESRHP